MGEGAQWFRSISPGDFLGLAPLCFLLGLGAILHARRISWSCCRLLARFGAKEEDWFPFSLSRRLMALVNHSPFGAPFLRLLCVLLLSVVGYDTVEVNESDELNGWPSKALSHSFFSELGRVSWTILFENSLRRATILFLPFLNLEIWVKTNRFLTFVSCFNSTTLNTEGGELRDKGPGRFPRDHNNGFKFKYVSIHLDWF